MPELPEVETIRRGIEPHLVGSRAVGVIVRNPRLRWPIPCNLEKMLFGQKICSVNRRAKYLLLECELGTLIIHLGMSGSLRLLMAASSQQIPPPEKHDHFDLMLDSGAVLRLRDPRRFGAVLWEVGDAKAHPLLLNLGPEPLSDDFSEKILYKKTRGLRTNIKTFLMSSRAVVGVGNIYANEALFHAGINPNTSVSRIGIGRYKKLVRVVKEVLALAIEAGGSSLRDFVNIDGKPGYFQQQYWVYGRTGQLCRKCSAIIKQIKLGQRSSFYCPSCQR